MRFNLLSEKFLVIFAIKLSANQIIFDTHSNIVNGRRSFYCITIWKSNVCEALENTFVYFPTESIKIVEKGLLK